MQQAASKRQAASERHAACSERATSSRRARERQQVARKREAAERETARRWFVCLFVHLFVFFYFSYVFCLILFVFYAVCFCFHFFSHWFVHLCVCQSASRLDWLTVSLLFVFLYALFWWMDGWMDLPLSKWGKFTSSLVKILSSSVSQIRWKQLRHQYAIA